MIIMIIIIIIVVVIGINTKYLGFCCYYSDYKKLVINSLFQQHGYKTYFGKLSIANDL